MSGLILLSVVSASSDSLDVFRFKPVLNIQPSSPPLKENQKIDCRVKVCLLVRQSPEVFVITDLTFLIGRNLMYKYMIGTLSTFQNLSRLKIAATAAVAQQQQQQQQVPNIQQHHACFFRC